MQEVGSAHAAPTYPAHAELTAEAMADVSVRARRYLQQPADDTWHDLVQALTRTHGDSDAYDLLRAVEIHTKTSRR